MSPGRSLHLLTRLRVQPRALRAEEGGKQTRMGDPSMEHPRILVVDDDLALCELVRSVFELEGLDVFEAHHVVEAERLIVEKVPDAIILDIGLPGVDGLVYCQRLRDSPRT